MLHPTYFDCVSTEGRHLEALVYRGAAEVVHQVEAVRDERLLHVDCAAWSATEVRWGWVEGDRVMPANTRDRRG